MNVKGSFAVFLSGLRWTLREIWSVIRRSAEAKQAQRDFRHGRTRLYQPPNDNEGGRR